MPKRILVVEDNPDNMYVLDRLLSYAGYSIHPAVNGQEALRMLATSPFDLVLMDMQMPGLDGYATVRAIREQPVLQDIPIIAVTAHSMAGDRDRTLDAGCTDYIAKPIDTRNLLQLVSNYLEGADVGQNTDR